MKSSTGQILAGLALGVAVGLFLGDRAAFFHYVADAYVRLLQMTVLPYVTVSLIGGIGKLDGQQMRRLFARVGVLTVVLWALALGLALLMPLAFPVIQSASFFSTTLVEERAPLDFISLYIPTNPFHSLANAVVPAVVLFSAFLGVALIGIERKERLIDALDVMEAALAQANRFAARLTPIGLFAIAAYTAGTLDVEQVARLRVFLVVYAAVASLLALWLLPGLVACLTPIPAGRILRRTRDALITAFMTGELFIVLPVLIDRAKELLRESGLPESEEASPDVIVPAFFNFPHSAKVLTLSFVLFAAWYSETQLDATDYLRLSITGIVSMFGSTNLAVPYLLDLVRVPADTFQLFVAAGIVNQRFGTLAAASHMVTLALIGPYLLQGTVRFSGARILRYGLVTAGLTAATVVGAGAFLRATGPGGYDKDRVVREMQALRPSPVEAVVLRAPPANPPKEGLEGETVLEDMRSRGRLRVGYFGDQPPFSYFNGRDKLVGFDVELAYLLAEELGLSLEFVPVTREGMEAALRAGLCDLVMSGVVVTTRRAAEMVFAPSYLDETFAFLVPDHRRSEFLSAEKVRAARGLRVAVPDLQYVQGFVRREFPNVQIVPVTVRQAYDFLYGRGPQLDALALTAERGSFLTLLRPAFSVAVPHPLKLRIPLGYPVAGNDREFARFLGTWLDLKKKDGTLDRLYDHWILGRTAHLREPRWSILRNVLHWVE